MSAQAYTHYRGNEDTAIAIVGATQAAAIPASPASLDMSDYDTIVGFTLIIAMRSVSEPAIQGAILH